MRRLVAALLDGPLGMVLTVCAACAVLATAPVIQAVEHGHLPHASQLRTPPGPPLVDMTVRP